MVFIRCVHGVHQMRSWCSSDAFMVFIRCVHGVHQMLNIEQSYLTNDNALKIIGHGMHGDIGIITTIISLLKLPGVYQFVSPRWKLRVITYS